MRFRSYIRRVTRTGINIGFTDRSLKQSKYALCTPYRQKYVGIYAEVPDQGIDEFAKYRKHYQAIDMVHLHFEEPNLFERLTKGEPPLFRPDSLFWHDDVASKYGLSVEDTVKLKSYIVSKPSPKVLFNMMPDELVDELLEEANEQVISEWQDMAYDSQIRVCKPCPIRPLDEDNCYIRFSNYPGMSGFKLGFALSAWYAVGIDEEKLKDAYFSFPHLDRQKGELPRDKISELFEMCGDTPLNMSTEDMFNNVVDMLERKKPPDVESDAHKVDTTPMPQIDKVVSTYIYRSTPYNLEDTRKVLPYFETLLEVADWAIWDADDSPVRRSIIAFRQRFDGLVTALKIADKYGLEVAMSY